jgi:hypothetical protein
MPVDPAIAETFGDDVVGLLEPAAEVWQVSPDVPQVELDFEVGAGEAEAGRDELGNWVGLAYDWPFGDELAMTVSTYEVDTGRLIAAQIWINGDRPVMPMLEPSAAHYDLQGVMAHEFGHLLGLGEAPEVPGATMNPAFRRGETHQRTLDETDEQALSTLYAEFPAQELVSACTASLRGARRAPAWLLLGLCVVGLFVRRRVAAPTRPLLLATLLAAGVVAYAPRVEGEPNAEPATTLAAEQLAGFDAGARHEALLAGADALLVGRVEKLATRMEHGLIWSRYRVRSESLAVEVELPGGRFGKLEQSLSEQPDHPREGETIVLARSRGALRWARAAHRSSDRGPGR